MSWRGEICKHVRELRFLVSAQAESSAAVRSYYKNNFAELKMLNPTTPFLIRDGWPGKDPYIVATYDWNKTVKKTLGGLTESQIDQVVKELVETGKTLPKYSNRLSQLPEPIVDGL